MDNENIYDAAYSETEVSEEVEVKHTFNEEPNKDKKKKRTGRSKILQVLLAVSKCCITMKLV